MKWNKSQESISRELPSRQRMMINYIAAESTTGVEVHSVFGRVTKLVNGRLFLDSDMSDQHMTYPDSQFKIPKVIANDSFSDSYVRRPKVNHVNVPLTKHLAQVKIMVNPIVRTDGIENLGFVHENPVQYRKEQIKFSLKDARRRLLIMASQDELGKQTELINLPIFKQNDERLSLASETSWPRQESLNAIISPHVTNNSPSQQETSDVEFLAYLAKKWHSQSRQESLDAMSSSDLVNSSSPRKVSLDARSSSDFTSSSSSRPESLDAMSSSDLTSSSSSRQDSLNAMSSSDLTSSSSSRLESLDAMSSSDLTSSSLSRQDSLDVVSSSDLANSSSSRLELLDAISSSDLVNKSYSRQDSEDALSSLGHMQQVKMRCDLCLADDATTESFIMLVTCRHTFCSSCLDAWPKDRTSCPSCKGPHRLSTRNVRDLVKRFVKMLSRDN